VIRIATALYRLLLRLLPTQFRREFGGEAATVFERVVRDALEEHGRLGAFRAAWLGWIGILRGVGEEVVDGVKRTVSAVKDAIDLTGLGLDLKQAWRGLKSRPGMALTVFLTVAMSVGATTSVYSVVDGVLLQPLPYPESERLGRIWNTRPDWADSPREFQRAVADRLNPHGPAYYEWSSRDTGFESLGAYVDASFDLQGADGAAVLYGQEVTSGLFESLGVEPIVGRRLQPFDDGVDAPAVVVLSEGFWKERFGGVREALGMDLVLNGTPHTVVGVMPAGFQAPPETTLAPLLPAGPPRLWTPLTEEARTGWKNVAVVGRLAPGVELAVAADRMSAVHASLAGADAAGEGAVVRGVRVESLLDSAVGGVRSTLWFLLGAVTLVLVVAIVNIANILTALGLTRRHELAVRAALGAGSARLVRSLFVESAVLAVLGGVGGIFVAWVTLPILLGLLPPNLPRQDMIGMNGSVLLLGLAVTGLTALLVGTLPAILAARAHPHEAMGASGRTLTAGRRAGRVRAALVVAEVSLAFTLLVGAGLLAGSYVRLSSVDRGFVTEGLAAMWVDPRASSHTAEEFAQFSETLRDQLERVPGVTASVANHLPLSGLSSATTFTLEQAATGSERISALLTVGLENYLDVLGVPILEGRGFDRSDAADTPPVAIVNETMARMYWPDEGPVGQRLQTFDDDEAASIEIIGVAADVRHRGLAIPVEPNVYLPASQSGRDTNEWILRIQGDVGVALERARAAVTRVSPTTAVTRVLILDETVANSVALPRFRTVLVVGLAGLAAVLALLGVYGSLAFAVTQRTQEIGVRMALGAQQRQVVLGVVSSGLRLVGAGIAVGLILAWIGSSLLTRFLFEITPNDVQTYVAIVVGLLIVGGLAAYLPARRAAAVDPVRVLTSG